MIPDAKTQKLFRVYHNLKRFLLTCLVTNSSFALAKHTPPFGVAPIRTVYNAFSYLLNVLFNSGA
jgi:hypothetical protein